MSKERKARKARKEDLLCELSGFAFNVVVA